MNEFGPASGAGIPEFPTDRSDSCPFDPAAAYPGLRAEEPVTLVRCPAGMDAWLVSRYDDIREVLANPRLSSRGAGARHMLPSFADPDPAPGMVFQLDGQDHGRLRRLLASEFTVRRTEALRPSVQQVADQLVDAMLAGSDADLIRDFALPLTLMVICELLGVPYDDPEALKHDSEVLSSFDTDDAAQEAAGLRLGTLLSKVVGQRLAEPRDDLLSRLITRGNQSDQPMTTEELVNLGVLLTVAGHDTSANMIGLSMLALLENPDQLAALRAAPDTVDTAAEELLRYLSVIQFGVPRYATEDVTVAGTEVKAGEWLVAAIASGNRDDSAFTYPDTVDLRRQTRAHLAFGFGPHQCVGQHLARVELQVALSTLVRRVPGLRLARPLERSDFKLNDISYGLWNMPVVW